MGLFSKIKEGLKKTKEAISFKIEKLFTGGVLTDDFFDELELVLISSDIGQEAAEEMLDGVRDEVDKRHIREQEPVKEVIREIIGEVFERCAPDNIEYPCAIMVVGVNGTGKTTAVGKLAHNYVKAGKKVVIAAADTFRAAAADQLAVWADRAGCRLIRQNEGSDPAAVVFDAIASAKASHADVLLIDTAGRLHNKKNLMEELKKINRVIEKEYASAYLVNYLVLDATTGQNALSQVELFDEAVDIDGIILTKLDGTAKGGVAIAIAKEYEVPVVYIGVGEGAEDLQVFDASEFVAGII